MSKTINSLMKHLRNNKKLHICGSSSKQYLLNYGYFHGYKGYRVYKDKPCNYFDFEEIIAVIIFDNELKSLFYSKIMFIETALKNRTIIRVLNNSKKDDFHSIFKNVLNDYINEAPGSKNMEKSIKCRLDLQKKIYGDIAFAYSKNSSIIKHYNHNNINIPIWAIFEIVDMGTFGSILKSMNRNVKLEISEDLAIPKKLDKNGEFLQNAVFIIKELRNYLAHNGIIFDVRFKQNKISKDLCLLLESETKVLNLNFGSIVDYIILTVYFLKKLNFKKSEIKKFIKLFEKKVSELEKEVPLAEFKKIIPQDSSFKISKIKEYLKT